MQSHIIDKLLFDFTYSSCYALKYAKVAASYHWHCSLQHKFNPIEYFQNPKLQPRIIGIALCNQGIRALAIIWFELQPHIIGITLCNEKCSSGNRPYKKVAASYHRDCSLQLYGPDVYDKLIPESHPHIIGIALCNSI